MEQENLIDKYYQEVRDAKHPELVLYNFYLDALEIEHTELIQKKFTNKAKILIKVYGRDRVFSAFLDVLGMTEELNDKHNISRLWVYFCKKKAEDTSRPAKAFDIKSLENTMKKHPRLKFRNPFEEEK